MLHIAILTGSTRPGRVNRQVADWVYLQLSNRQDATFEIVDIADYQLPLLDETVPAAFGEYAHEHTKRWAARIDTFDAFIFISPEYNHSTSAALKNALDYLSHEWSDKAAGLVGYGGSGGVRALEHLRPVLSHLKMADVSAQVLFSLFTDFENFSIFKPDARHIEELDIMTDQVISWGKALQTIRTSRNIAVS